MKNYCIGYAVLRSNIYMFRNYQHTKLNGVFMDKLFPHQARHRIADLISDESSDETKAQTARWFAEMMIKEFLSTEFGEVQNHNKLSLGDLISKLRGNFDVKIINALNLIKDFGDRASHYDPNRKINCDDAQKAVSAAFNLFPLIIADHLKKLPLDSHPDRATLLSTTLPAVRIKVIEELICFDRILGDEYQVGLLHKWCLAQVKNGSDKKAKRKMNLLLNNGKISKQIHEFEIKTINEISDRMKKGELPIPVTHNDFSRNFADVMGGLSVNSKKFNIKFINILECMTKNIPPSEMGLLKGMQIFVV